MAKRPKKEQRSSRPGESRSPEAPPSDSNLLHENAKESTRENAKSELGKRIRQLADSVGGASALAEKLGISPQMVANWTSGRNMPGGECLAALVKVTACSGTWLLTGDGDPFAEPDPAVVAGRVSVDQARQNLLDSVAAVMQAITALSPALETADRKKLRAMTKPFLDELEKSP